MLGHGLCPNLVTSILSLVTAVLGLVSSEDVSCDLGFLVLWALFRCRDLGFRVA